MRPIRIKGLVAAARSLRTQLEAGPSARELGELTLWRTNLLHQVREILASHSAGIEALSPQSREALRFIERTDPSQAEPSPLGRRRAIRLRGVNRQVAERLDELWERREDLLRVTSAQTAFAASTGFLAEAIAAVCDREGGRPEDLLASSLEGYAWLKLFSDPDVVHGAARALCSIEAEIAAVSSGLQGYMVLPVLQRPLWRIAGAPPKMQFKVHLSFIAAESRALNALARCLALLPRDDDRAFVRAESRSQSVLAFHRRISEILDGDDQSARERGLHRDLGEAFARVAGAHFPGLERPQLRWSEDATQRLFGRFEAARDRITISRTLDDPEVPEFVLDFVLYHELLHKVMGVELKGDRTRVHTPQFREAEAQFPRSEQALAWLKRLAHRR